MEYLFAVPENMLRELLDLDYILINYRYKKLVHFVEERNDPACDVLCPFNTICAFKSNKEYKQFLNSKDKDKHNKYYFKDIYRNLYIERLNIILNKSYTDIVSSFLDTKTTIKAYNNKETKIKLKITFKDNKKLTLTNGEREHPYLSDSCYEDLHKAIQRFLNYNYLL